MSVKDEEGFPSFALVNKATGQAIKHSIDAAYPDKIKAPMWADLSLWGLTNDKTDDLWFDVSYHPYYMALEVLKQNYGLEVDIWRAGVILYILLCGVPPFWAETEQGVALAILRGVIDFKREPWPQISENAKGLVKQMLEPDPKKRSTSQQVIAKHLSIEEVEVNSDMFTLMDYNAD